MLLRLLLSELDDQALKAFGLGLPILLISIDIVKGGHEIVVISPYC
jgi:hypothetical protein